jgi:hypothetical protein
MIEQISLYSIGVIERILYNSSEYTDGKYSEMSKKNFYNECIQLINEIDAWDSEMKLKREELCAEIEKTLAYND